MNRFAFNIIILAGLMFFAAAFAEAQVLRDEVSSIKLLNRIDKTKQLKKGVGSGFVLLSPSDSASFSEIDLLSMDPCTTAFPISNGEVRNGDLNQSDCRLEDNSYADFYTFNGTQGQQIQIFLSSTAIDTYLGLANESGSFVVEDDDGGEGTNAYLNVTLPETGAYIILANSALPLQFGEYTLSLSPTPYCAYSISPTSAEASPSGGNYSFNVTTQIGCSWRSYSTPNTFISTDSRGNGPGIVSYSVEPNGPTPRSGNITLVPGYSPVPTQNLIFTVNQPPLFCEYSLGSTSINLSGAQYIGTFEIFATPGCFWDARSNDWFLSSNSYGRGNGTVEFMAVANNGADRTGTITVAGLTFTVNQQGLNCTYSVSPVNIIVDKARQYGTITVATQPNCTWSIYRQTWVSVVQGGVGPGTASFLVFENFGQTSRTDNIPFSVSGAPGSTNISITQTSTTFARNSTFDFDGDRKTDISITRMNGESREWWYQRSQSGSVGAVAFGMQTDTITPADFTGDGRTDIAFWRGATGEWFILRSEDSTFYSFPFGGNGDVPVPADYDGDGKADAAVFRPNVATWFVSRSLGGTFIQTFGANGDAPVPADFDGDGRADLAVYRSNGANKEWWYQKSTDNTVSAFTFGTLEDKAVAGDYTGDGKADIAIWRPSNGNWYVLRSENFSFYSFPFGAVGDFPAPGDYDGDGKIDASVFRPSTSSWFVNGSSSGTQIMGFGGLNDRPLANSFVR
ncbi:MAG: VCBS repeat-containing protein [Pyrinomonadaceae bacterium]|nr:VCBS repeat-containing protein [Pyrinomonadaceae bacterium]